MGKRFWSLVLTSALVASVLAIAPAGAQGAADLKLFFRSEGCPAVGGNFDFLSITDAEDAVECNHTGSGIRNEIGETTGTIGAQGQNAVSYRETATRYWDSTDGGPISLDVSRPVTGELYTMGASCVNATVPCTPVGAGAGEVIIELELFGYVGETETPLGVQTDSFDVVPGAPHKSDIKIPLDPAAAGKTFDRIELRTWTHGPSAGHGMIKTTGDANSFITVPVGGAVVKDPGTPVKPKKPVTGKDCGKGKSKGGGKGPKDCPDKPKKPGKPKPPADSCAPFKPAEAGAEAPTSIVTDAATEEKPVVVEYDAEMGGPTSPLVNVFDLRSFVYHNVQVNSASPSTGLYVKTEFTENHDYDLALLHADGSEAASSGESQPEPGLGAGSPEGAWEGGSNYEMLKGISTTDCAGYTARVAGYLTTGGPVTISMWLGPVVGEPAAPGGELASDMFFNALGMRSPMREDSAQASQTPAADKGCKKGKGKKKGCKKPPVACSPITPAEQGAGKPTVVVTDAATAEAPLEQTVTLDMSTADFTPTDASYDYFNVQVDSAAASAGLYATFEFDTRRDYDLYLRWSDGSEAASSHGFNPAVEAEAPEPVPFDPSNQRGNHAGDTNADSENIIGLITPDCGGYTVETVNWLGEGGEFTVKLWLGEGTTEPRPVGEVPAA